MSLNLSSESIRSLLALTEERDALRARIASLDAEITARIGGSSAPVSSRSVRRSTSAPKGRKKRGAVKELILSALREAGKAGISVKELSQKLGLKNTSVHVWFGTTGKTIKEIEKAGKGLYRFVSDAIVPQPAPTPAPAPAKPAAKKAKKVKKPAAKKTAPKAKPAAKKLKKPASAKAA